jgi:hypothetical protein
MRKKLVLAAAVVAVGAATVVPLTAAAGRHDGVTIAVRLDFANPKHATGTFAVCCSVNDAGSASADIVSFVPHRDTADFKATNAFVGKKGSFTIRLTGTSGPLAGKRHIARARWRVVTGSGAYAKLEAQGRLTALTDLDTGALTAIDTGTATHQ